MELIKSFEEVLEYYDRKEINKEALLFYYELIIARDACGMDLDFYLEKENYEPAVHLFNPLVQIGAISLLRGAI